MSAFQLKNKINGVYGEYQTALSKILEHVPFVCEAVDIWSTKRRSFMGMSLHYVDPNTLERKSFALSCAEFESPHNNERIAEHLQLIHSQYGLMREKIVATVTDNASNFVKALREFGDGSNEFDDDSSSGDDDIIFPEINGLAMANHYRCNSHTFNLMGSTDIANAQKDPIYKKVYTSAFSKLNRVWSLASRPGSNETIRSMLGCSLTRPSVTRWNGLYDSVSELLRQDAEKLSQLMLIYKIEPFTMIEREFLCEYKLIMQSISNALDNLQSNCYYAIFLPTLLKVKSDIYKFLVNPQTKMCKPLVEALKSGFEKRFEHHLDLQSERSISGFIAAVTHPYFKLRWLDYMRTSENIDKIQKLLIKAADSISSSDSINSNNVRSNIEGEIENFTFNFELASKSIDFYLLIFYSTASKQISV